VAQVIAVLKNTTAYNAKNRRGNSWNEFVSASVPRLKPSLWCLQTWAAVATGTVVHLADRLRAHMEHRGSCEALGGTYEGGNHHDTYKRVGLPLKVLASVLQA
jgi:hypothetical protein